MDPNDTKAPETGTDPAAAAAEGAAAIDAALTTPPPDDGADMIAAMDQAIAEADDGDSDDAPAAPQKPPADDPPPADDKDGKPAAKPDGETGPDGKPIAKPEDKAKPDEKPTPDADAVAEAKSLGLKDKANERFVEMATTIKTLAPMKEALDKAGIKDIAELPKMVERAKAADDMISLVMDTGADAEQYGKTLDYLGVLNKGLKGDKAAAEQAWAMVLDETKSLAELLGKELPGVVDPLAAHPDLQQEVADGDLKRERALQIAAERSQSKLSTAADQQQRAATERQQAEQRALDQGVASLRQWEADKVTDPAYLAVRTALSEEVAKIRSQFPPAQWAAATELAYRAIRSQATPAAPSSPSRKPPVGPMRPGMAPANLHQTTFDDPISAIDAGIEAAG